MNTRANVHALRNIPGLLFAAAAGGVVLPGCDSPDRAPAGFAPAQAAVREDSHIARCNTVHSLSVPASLIHGYGITPDENTVVITCALQVMDDIGPAYIAAQVEGWARAAAGRVIPVDFKAFVDPGAISYLASFSLADQPAVELRVKLTDLRSGAAFDVMLEQAGLAERALPGSASEFVHASSDSAPDERLLR